MNPKWLRSAMLSVIVASAMVAVSGCSSTSSTQPSPATSSPAGHSSVASATPTAAPTSKALPPPQTITGEPLDGMKRSMDTLYKPCSQTTTEFGAATIFDPQAGKFITGPTPPALAPGTELVGGGNPAYLCTLTGTPNDLKVFYVWYFRTPSHGLEAQKFTLMAGVGGIHDKTLAKVAELPADLGGGPSRIYTTTGGVVLSYCCRSDGISTAAIDPETLTVKWTSPHSLASFENSSVAFQDVFENTVTIRDVASGTDTVLNHAQLAGSAPNAWDLPTGYLIQCVHDNVECAHDKALGDNVFGYYSMVAHQFFPRVFTADSSPEPKFNDGRMMLQSKKSLKLIDVATGAVVFELNPAEMAAVDSYRFAAAGNYLYIANQSDSPVIDIRDRKQVSSGWKVRPVGPVGQNWMLVDHRQNSTDYDVSGDLVLQHLDNGVYPGPWY
jgi:hypothetical protein